MGVPRFFRWLSERYALCSTVVSEGKTPEFDNLYLDMNGIVHQCSRPVEGDVQFRITEDQIFLAIFNYIDHIFDIVRPKKLFYMAIDGVAPRAKMNQQRSRRYRTAKEAAEEVKKALQKGVELPKEEPFDKNCITPGTVFMSKLVDNLKYFVHKKVSEDRLWQDITVILSGPDVPGEGEHKIMEYIRVSRSQPGYEPNLRHCLYGLDADLIMLGLLSHEPHFALLREEVSFGRKKKTLGGSDPTNQKFCLLHLSLIREYLELEFSSLKTQLSFKFDVERIIDDFVLLMYFIGNDFLPPVKNFGIRQGAVGIMFESYKAVLPRLGGYINEHGVINLSHLQKFLADLAKMDREAFELERVDLGSSKSPSRRPQQISETQNKLVKQAIAFIEQKRIKRPSGAPRQHKVEFDTKMTPVNKAFLVRLAQELNIDISENVHFDEDTNQSYPVLAFEFGSASSEGSSSADSESGDDSDNEGEYARLRVLKAHLKIPIVPDSVEDALALHLSDSIDEVEKEFVNWKHEYYREKLHFTSPKQVEELVHTYIEGVQWVLFYYSRGIPAWEWFFPYHHGPYLSDIVNIDGFKFSYELGSPFLPFEQLMGVLPPLSKALIPSCLQDLMIDENSPIIDFYPQDFEVDVNPYMSKFEAIVLIPFIDQKRLLDAVVPRYKLLSAAEKLRNSAGQSWSFKYSAKLRDCDQRYKSKNPDVLPDIHPTFCIETELTMPEVLPENLRRGLVPGCKIGKECPFGFPTLYTLPFTNFIGFHTVNVLDSPSTNEAVVLTLQVDVPKKAASVAAQLLGKRVYVSYPHFYEAVVVSVSDDSQVFGIDLSSNEQFQKPVADRQRFLRRTSELQETYSLRKAIIVDNSTVMVTVAPFCGMKVSLDGSRSKNFDTNNTEDHLLSTILSDCALIEPDMRYLEQPSVPVEKAFTINEKVFFVHTQNADLYGAPAKVIGFKKGKLVVTMAKHVGEYELTRRLSSASVNEDFYESSSRLARRLGVHPLALSKITSSCFVLSSSDAGSGGGTRYNIGLNLKFEARQRKVLGYSKKNEHGWSFSVLALKLIEQYLAKFPEVFDKLRAPRSDANLTSATLFPNMEPAQALARLIEINDFVRSLKVNELVRVPLNTELLSREQVATYEGIVGSVPSSIEAVEYDNVSRLGVLKPSDSECRLVDQEFRVGDRVICVSDHGRAPFAGRGVVVGLSGSSVDVVFDNPILSGDDLDGRCSAFRGMVVKATTLLNISRRPSLEEDRRVSSQKSSRSQFAVASSGSRYTLRTQRSSSGAEIAPIPSLNAVPQKANAWTKGAAAQILLPASQDDSTVQKPRGKSAPAKRQPQASVKPANSSEKISAEIFKAIQPSSQNALKQKPDNSAPNAWLPKHPPPAMNGGTVPATGEMSAFGKFMLNYSTKPAPISQTDELTDMLRSALHLGSGPVSDGVGSGDSRPSKRGRGRSGRGTNGRGRGRNVANR